MSPQLMTLHRRPYQLAKRGFSLLEVVISISIIGILSGIAIPTYQFFVEEKKNISSEQDAIMIKDDMLSYMATYQNGSSGYDYPIVGLQSTATNGTTDYCNIKYTQLVTFSQGLANNVTLFSYSSNYKNYEYEMGTVFKSGVTTCTVTLNFKDQKRIIFYYDVYDNSLNYRDLAYLIGFTYFSSDGASCYQAI